jgi:tyrosyl-tRNA synthetase
MSRPRSDFVRELVARGFVHQATDLEGIDALAAKGRLTAYIGFDCTADSLHVGNLVSIMMLRWLQRTGQRPIALIGGGTSKVGDPSGKDESRQLLDDATLAANSAGVRRSLDGFLEFGDPCRTGPTTEVGPGSQARGQALLVDNAEWLDELRYIPFLRDYGRHFTINRMLTFDSVKLRLEREQPLTFLEFNYMVMQAYDFLELARRYDCRLQMGGSDQWGNIVNGVELGRRAEGLELFGLTTPLITTSSGAKMGKTAQGAVWLNPEKLRHFEYYQYWRNVDDADVGRFLKLFTDKLSLEEIEDLEKLEGAELNHAKDILAFEATKLCRGEEAAISAREEARSIFRSGSATAGDQFDAQVARHASVNASALASAQSDAVQVPRSEFEHGVTVVELFRRAGLVPSNGEARRLIRGGGARINDRKVEDESLTVGLDDLVDGQLLLSAGKKRHARVRAV